MKNRAISNFRKGVEVTQLSILIGNIGKVEYYRNENLNRMSMLEGIIVKGKSLSSLNFCLMLKVDLPKTSQFPHWC